MEKRVKQLLSLACVGVFTLVMTESSRGQQPANVLLADPGAEQELSAPNPNPTGLAGWSFFNGTQFLTTPSALGGTNVIETPSGGGGYSVPGADQVFAASAGQTFIFSGWIMAPQTLTPNGNGFALLQLGFFTGAPPSNYGGGTEIGSASSPNYGQPAGGGGIDLPAGVWTYAAVTGTAANVGLNHVNSLGAYILDINSDTTATFYFDNMSLVLVPEPSTVALVLSGLAGGFLFLRKRRK
jgi:hypothetical protein